MLLSNRNTVIANLELVKDALFATTELEKEKDSLEEEIEIEKELYRKNLSSGPLTETNKLNSIEKRYNNTLTKLSSVCDEITERKNKRLGINKTIRQLKESPQQVSDFSEELWIGLINKVTVYEKKKIEISFKDGTVYVS